MGASLECYKRNRMFFAAFIMPITPRREWPNVGEIEAEVLITGLPSKKFLRWLRNLVASLLSSFLEIMITV